MFCQDHFVNDPLFADVSLAH